MLLGRFRHIRRRVRVGPPMNDDHFKITHVFAIFRTEEAWKRIQAICAGRWECTPCDCHSSLVADDIVKRVEKFYGKRSFLGRIPLKGRRDVWWLFRGLLGGEPPAKLGESGKIVYVHREVFPDEPDFALLTELQKSLRDYYLLIVLGAVNVWEAWESAHRAGASIILDPIKTTPERLQHQVFAARAAEDRVLGYWMHQRWNQISTGLLSIAFAAFLTFFASALAQITISWVNERRANADSAWTGSVYLGDPRMVRLAPTDPCQYVEVCLHLLNDGKSPKWGFLLEPRLKGLDVRNLPPYVPRKLAEGESAEVRFYIGIPDRLPAGVQPEELKISVTDRQGVGTELELPESLRDVLRKRQPGGTP